MRTSFFQLTLLFFYFLLFLLRLIAFFQNSFTFTDKYFCVCVRSVFLSLIMSMKVIYCWFSRSRSSLSFAFINLITTCNIIIDTNYRFTSNHFRPTLIEFQTDFHWSRLYRSRRSLCSYLFFSMISNSRCLVIYVPLNSSFSTIQ